MKRLPSAKAIGSRGSWFAHVEGERLPCVHQYWAKGGRYDDPGFIKGQPPWPEFIEAILSIGKVILTKDNAPDPAKGQTEFQRDGYIAVFSVADVRSEKGHLLFQFADRLINLV